MKKHLILSLVIGLNVCILSACYDRKDVDELNLMTLIGLDQTNENFEMNGILVNFGAGKSNNKFIKQSAESLSKMMDTVAYEISGELSMDLLRVIVVSKNYGTQSMHNLAEWINKEDINGQLSLSVFEGDVSELINTLNGEQPQDLPKQDNGGSASKSNDEKEMRMNDVLNIITAKVTSGYKISQTYRDFMIYNESKAKTALLPILALKDEENVEFIGTQIFKHYQSIGELDADETQQLMLLRGIQTKGIIEFNEVVLQIEAPKENWLLKNQKPDPDWRDKNLTVGGSVLVTNKRDVKLEKKDGTYNFIITINLEGEILELKQDDNFIFDRKDNIQKIEQAVVEKVKKQSEEFITHVRDEIGYDIFDVAKYMKIRYGTESETLFDHHFFDHATIEVNVKVHLK